MLRRLRRHSDPDAAPPRLVLRWDLDKTYLKSEFESLRDMVRIPFEKAQDKVAAPGVAALVRGLRESAERSGREMRVYFISASPPQIGRAILEKLALDGVVHDGIVFKDQLQHLVRGKFRHLREQVGFKVTELLKARRADPSSTREYLFGDDWESDPLIYSLYADVVAGRLTREEIVEILRALRVDPPLVEEACALAEQVVRADAVARIFINLERRTAPARLRCYGLRLVPTFNYLQTAACLFEEGVLDLLAVEQVALSLLHESHYSPARLANSLADLERRGHLQAFTARRLREHLRELEILPPKARTHLERLRWWWERRRVQWGGQRVVSPTPPVEVDYRALIGAEAPARSATA